MIRHYLEKEIEIALSEIMKDYDELLLNYSIVIHKLSDYMTLKQIDDYIGKMRDVINEFEKDNIYEKTTK